MVSPAFFSQFREISPKMEVRGRPHHLSEPCPRFYFLPSLPTLCSFEALPLGWYDWGLFSPYIHQNCSGCSELDLTVPIFMRSLSHACLTSLQMYPFGAECSSCHDCYGSVQSLFEDHFLHAFASPLLISHPKFAM